MKAQGKPAAAERGDYYQQYIDRVDSDDLREAFARQDAEIAQLFAELDEAKGNHRYAPDKWSVKQLLGHLIDSERVFGYRAISIARGDQQNLPGFSEDDFVAASNYDSRTLADIEAELLAVRASTRALFAGLADESLTIIGHANGLPASPRAIGYVLVGHLRHHFGVLRERYL
jgi:hypothetical protein